MFDDMRLKFFPPLALPREIRLAQVGAIAAIPAIILVAFTVRVWLVSLPYVIKGDESAYLTLSQNLLAGQGLFNGSSLEFTLNPLFPMVLALLTWATGLVEPTTRMSFVIFGSLTVLPVYLLAKELYGTKVGLVSSLIVAVLPVLTVYLLYEGYLSEPPFVLFLISATYAILRGLRTGAISYNLGAGLLFGLAYLTRSEGYVFFAAALFILAAIPLAEKKWRNRQDLLAISALVGGFAIAAAPYVVYLHQVTGKWMLSGKSWIAYAQNRALSERDLVAFEELTWGLDPAGQEVMVLSESRLDQGMLSEITRDAGRALRNLKHNIFRIEALLREPKIVPVFMLPLVALGLLRRPWRSNRTKGELFVLVIPIVTVVVVLPVSIIIRFLAPIFPVLAIWMANGLTELGDWLRETLRESWPSAKAGGWIAASCLALPLGLVLLYLIATYPSAVLAQQKTLEEPLVAKQYGLWLKGHLGPGAKIMSRDVTEVFYSGAGWVAFPDEDFGEIVRFAAVHQATHLLVAERSLRIFRPQLLFLIDEANPPAEIEPVDVTWRDSGKVVLYRFRGGAN